MTEKLENEQKPTVTHIHTGPASSDTLSRKILGTIIGGSIMSAAGVAYKYSGDIANAYLSCRYGVTIPGHAPDPITRAQDAAKGVIDHAANKAREEAAAVKEAARKEAEEAKQAAELKKLELQREIEEKKEEARKAVELRRIEFEKQRAINAEKAAELKRLADERMAAQEEYNRTHGPNGQCPFCRHGMRVSLRGTGRVACPKCGEGFSSARARSLGPPQTKKLR